MKDDRLYLVDMLETARRIQDRVSKSCEQDLLANEDLQLALTHLVQIIGEAARNVSEATRVQFGAVEWKLITGMRHRIVHNYSHVRLDVLWHTVSVNIPDLVEQLAPIVDPWIAEAKQRQRPPVPMRAPNKRKQFS